DAHQGDHFFGGINLKCFALVSIAGYDWEFHMRRPSEKAPVGGYPSFRKYTARNDLVDKNLRFGEVGW
ncbi:MAG: hypothetical protein WAT38_04895, partial [Nitrospira sp.]